jgi:formamidase
MADVLVKVDLNESPHTNEMIHNRWHPDIPMAEWVKPGDDFILETYDWTGGQIKNDDDAATSATSSCRRCTSSPAPSASKGAEPGDLLVVDILDIGAKPDSLWGFNGFFSKQNGGGFLTEHFPLAQKSIWDFEGMFTRSRHVPGVRYAGLIHPGLIGCLPDHAMLEMWNSREGAVRHRSRTVCRRLRRCPLEADRAYGPAQGRGPRQGRRRSRPHRSPARAWRQLRHQGPAAARRSTSRST